MSTASRRCPRWCHVYEIFARIGCRAHAAMTCKSAKSLFLCRFESISFMIESMSGYLFHCARKIEIFFYEFNYVLLAQLYRSTLKEIGKMDRHRYRWNFGGKKSEESEWIAPSSATRGKAKWKFPPTETRRSNFHESGETWYGLFTDTRVHGLEYRKPNAMVPIDLLRLYLF